ncbi:MAG: MFS transporter [bacterium]|nr:MFS transporter [bacterium]
MFKKLLPILALSFVNILGFSILIPVLPEVVNQFSDTEYAGTIYGLLISSYAFSQFLAAPILGSLSDRFGRRPLLLISQTGTMLSWVIFGLAYYFGDIGVTAQFQLGLFIIAFSRIIDGLTGGNISVGQAWISDMTTPEEKTKAFGLEGAVFGVGFLMGPLLGGLSFSTSYGLLGTAVVAFTISLVTLILMWLKLPESLPLSRRNRDLHFSWKQELRYLDKIGIFWKEKCLRMLLPLRLSYAFLFVCFTTSIILLMERDFQLTPSHMGMVFTVLGVYAFFNQAFVVPRVARALGKVKTFLFGSYVTAFALIFLSAIPILAGTDFSSFLVLILFFLNAYLENYGITSSMTTFRALITTLLPAEKHGLATGVDQSIGSLGQAIAPVIAGSIYDVFSFWSFGLYGVLLLIPAFYATMRVRRGVIGSC